MILDTNNDSSNIKVLAGNGKATSQYVTKILKPYLKDGKNILLQSDINEKDTKYIIKYDFDLDGKAISIQTGVIIEFDGGSFTNGDIQFRDTIVSHYGDLNDVLVDINIRGSYTEDIPGKATVAETANTLADKTNNTDGMGKIYLKKNKSIQEQMKQPNTVYVIQYDFDLGGRELVVPENCVLEFDGGSLRNGSVVGNGTIINANTYTILNNVELSGTICNEKIYPEWFGCIGDEVTDDTENLRKALYASHNLKIQLFLNPKKTYYVTDTLNYINGNYYDITLNIVGPLHDTPSLTFNPDIKCSIRLKHAITLFKNAVITGVIKNCIISVYDWQLSGTTMFYNCSCVGLTISHCELGRFTNFFHNCSLYSMSVIENNRIQTYNFAKSDEDCDTQGLVDSYIIRNFITGNMREVENTEDYAGVFSEWSTYNAATITNNFIDFFRIIFAPTKMDMIDSPVSMQNNYQVFRYFYSREKMFEDKECTQPSVYKTAKIHSIGDSFNWTNINSLDWLKKIKPLYIKEFRRNIKDSKNEEVNIEVPSYIITNTSNGGTIKDANIERNIDKFVFISTLIVRGNAVFDFSFKQNFSYDVDNTYNRLYLLEEEGYYYYYNQYQYPIIDKTYIKVDKLPELPSQYSDWYKYPIGYKVKYNDSIYKLSVIKYADKQIYEWVKETDEGFIDKQYIGASRFNTATNKPIWWTGSKWVDATGADV